MPSSSGHWFAADSPVEEGGFEPSVPLREKRPFTCGMDFESTRGTNLRQGPRVRISIAPPESPVRT